LLPVRLQVVSGYSPLSSGLALLPLTLIMLTLSARSGRLATRIGPRLQMSAGPLIVGAGLALLAFSNYRSSYVVYMRPAVVVFGLGLAVTVAPLTATAMSSAPAEHSGIASAVNNDVARFGGLLAVAVLPALAGISATAYLHRTRSPQDSGPRCSYPLRCAPPGAAGRVRDYQYLAGAPPSRCTRARGMPALRLRGATADNQRNNQLAQPLTGTSGRSAEEARPVSRARPGMPRLTMPRHWQQASGWPLSPYRAWRTQRVAQRTDRVTDPPGAPATQPCCV
jgi:MFS family permease